MEEDSIQDIGYVAVGCAISKAAASMMSEAVKGQSLENAQRVVSEFRHMLTDQRRSMNRTTKSWATWRYWKAFPTTQQE